MKTRPWKRIAALCMSFALINAFISSPLNAVELTSGSEKVLAADPVVFQRKLPATLSKSILGEIGWQGSGAGFSGVRMAVIDTGIDPSIVPLLVNFADLTGEGSVRTSQPLTPDPSGRLTYEGKTYDASGVRTKSGKLRLGIYVPEKSLPPGAPCREAFSQRSEIPVVVADNYLPGQYDTVYIDTNLNGSFQDEKGIEVFRNSKAWVSLRVAGSSGLFVTLCVADIFDNGGNIVLGFDGHGHGTSVGSIISGDGTNLFGVAPFSKISAIKAVDSTGRSTFKLLAQAVKKALEDEAQVIVLALAPDRVQDNDSSMIEAIREAEKRGVALVMAAGNLGPGLSSLPRYADYDNVITAGGYVPKAIADHLSLSGGGGWYPWSSCGPTEDGGTVSLVAPALAPGLLPSWQFTSKTPFLFEGTSASAAYVGGAAALILGQAASSGARLKPGTLKKVLEDGAAFLPGIEAVFQGKGLLNIGRSLEIAKELKEEPKVRAVFKWQGVYQAHGFFDREKFCGALPFTIDNLSPFSLRLAVKTPEWVRLSNETIGLPAVEYRSVDLSCDTSLDYGLHTGWIIGDDPNIPGTELSTLFAALKPKELSQLGHLGIQKILPAGEVHREYLRVPPGLEGLSLSAKIIETPSGEPRGRVQVFLYDPQGVLRYRSGWIGKDSGSNLANASFRFPSAGVWEICVMGDFDPSAGGPSDDSVFGLEVDSLGLTPKGPGNEIVMQQDVGAGRLAILNFGDDFQARAIPLIPGENGWFKEERVLIGPHSAVAKTMPDVIEGAEYLYLRADNPIDQEVDLDIYLYHFNKAQGQWSEVASAKNKRPGGEEIVLRAPAPGQYIAYVEASSLPAGETEFFWTAVQVKGLRPVDGTTIIPNPQAFEWKGKTERTIPVRLPKSLLDVCFQNEGPQRWDQSGTAYMTIWDDKTNALRTIVPLNVYKSSESPFVYVGKGASSKEGTAVTIKVWHPLYWKPLDAVVRLGDAWYQMEGGEATVLLRNRDLNGQKVEAYYPGMAPLRKTIVE